MSCAVWLVLASLAVTEDGGVETSDVEARSLREHEALISAVEDLDAGAMFDAGVVPDAGVVQVVADAPLLTPVDAGTRLFQTKVTATRGPDLRRVAGSAQVITEAELERRELDDIHRVLGGVPGVYFREEDGLGLRPNIGLRGVNPDRSSKVTLMEDGVLFGPAPYAAPEAYYFPMVTRMQSVEVYKGPGSIRFGPQTVGGAINLRTVPVPEGFTGFVDGNVGSRGTSRLQARVGGGTELWGLMAEGAYLEDPGFKVLDLGGDTGAQHGETMIKGRFSPTIGQTRHLFEAKLGLALEDSHETYTGISVDDFANTPYRRYQATALDEMKWWRTEGEVRWVGQLTDRLEVSVTGYRHDFNRNWHRLDHFRVGPGLYDLMSRPVSGASEQQYLAILRGDEDSQNLNQSLMALDNHRIFISEGVQALVHAKFNFGPIANELEAGARFHHDNAVHDHVQTGYQMRSGRLQLDGTPSEPILEDVGTARAVALHLNDTLSWGRFLLAPGARLELIDTIYGNHLTNTGERLLQVVPLLGVGAVVALPEGFNVFAGVHQGFSPVAPGQSSDIKPERAVHYELGVRLPNKRKKLELVGFWSEYSNITGECTGSTGCQASQINRQFNGGAARIIGLEAAGALTFSLPSNIELTAQASYTLTSARFESDFSSENPIWGAVVAGDFIPYVPMHQAAGRLLLERGPFSASVGLEVNGAFYEEAGNGDSSQLSVPTRMLLDATASYDFGPARFYLTGNNLLNEKTLVARRPYGARGLAPLNVIAGVRLSF